MNFFSFHIGDYAAHTKHLTLVEDIAYRRMLDLYYTSEKPLPLDVNQLARLIGMRDHLNDVQTIVGEFFTKSEDGYRSKRCDREIACYQAVRAGGKAGAAKRWAKDSYSPPITPPSGEPTHPPMLTKTINQDHLPIPISKAVSDKSLPAVPAAQKVGFDYQTGRFSGLIDNKALFESWMVAYPAVDIRTELNSMRAWLMSNPKNRKTNLQRFINNWLSKAQDQASKPQNKTSAERTQDYKDEQARKFYQPLLNATPEELAKWGLA